MRGNNSAKHWDKCHTERGYETKFNPVVYSLCKLCGVGGRVLNIGAGVSKTFTRVLNESSGEYYVLDISPIAVERWKRFDVNAEVFDVKEGNKLPYPDDYFDYIVSQSLLEHINKEDNIYLAKEIKRVLKPNGIYILKCASDEFLSTEGNPEDVGEHVYPANEGGIPAYDLIEIYKELTLVRYMYLFREHYAVYINGL